MKTEPLGQDRRAARLVLQTWGDADEATLTEAIAEIPARERRRCAQIVRLGLKATAMAAELGGNAQLAAGMQAALGELVHAIESGERADG